MRPDDFGPVPVSRLKVDASHVYDALEQGRRVLVSRHGTVVAAIDPPRDIEPSLLIDYALPGKRPLAELTATEINQRSPSRAVESAIDGDPSYVTRDGHVYGLLRPISPGELAAEAPTSEELSTLRSRIDQHMASNPQATAADIDGLVRTLGDAGSSSAARLTVAEPSLVRQVHDLADTVNRLTSIVSGEGFTSGPHVPTSVSFPSSVVQVASAAADQAAALLRTASRDL